MPLRGPLVSGPGVAVTATELAPDVGIDRPERHAGRFGRIENPLRGEAEKFGAPVAKVERGQRVASIHPEPELGCGRG